MSATPFTQKTKRSQPDLNDHVRLVIPLFLLNKLKQHPLTSGLYPLALGKSTSHKSLTIKQQNAQHHSLIYCQSGSGILDHKSKKREVKRGDLVVCCPHQAFQFSTKTSEKLNKENSFYWINFTGKLADDFAERLLMKMDDGFAHVGLLAKIIEDFDNLLALGTRGYTATNVIHGVHLLQQSLSSLALQLRLTAFNHNSHFDIDAVERLMRNNIHQELSLDTLAHYSQLSKFHFSKKFKELTDTSPIQHFINMKMQYACNELDNKNATIKQIAESLGYSDPYYFSRLFKKTVGMSPKQYRESHFTAG